MALSAWLGVGLLLVGAAAALLAARALADRSREGRSGRLLTVDVGSEGPVLHSERYGIRGRPDEMRRLPDGRQVPVELKSRPAPVHGPFRSHEIQLAAYCLLIEETTGRAPPFGILRYGDGSEFRIPYGEALREEVLDVRRALAGPYDGRASPSAAKCRGCRWRLGCDARAE